MQVAEGHLITSSSPRGIYMEAGAEGARLLIARAQRGGLTVEQLVKVAETIYLYSPVGSDEKREGARNC